MSLIPEGEFQPGTPAPASGVVRNQKTGANATVVAGEPLPPTGAAGQTWVYSLVTPHQDEPSPGALRPGTHAPASGILHNPQSGEYATITQGERLPPTDAPGQGWNYIMITPH